MTAGPQNPTGETNATRDGADPWKRVPYLDRVRAERRPGDAPARGGSPVESVGTSAPDAANAPAAPVTMAEQPAASASAASTPAQAPAMSGPREAFNAKIDRELAAATRAGVPITATGYLHLHLADVVRAARLFVTSLQLASGDPQVTLGEEFYEHLFAAFRDGDTAGGVTRLRNWIAPEDLLAIVDRNRPLYEAGDEQANAPNAALDYGHGPKGPAGWSEPVGIGVGSSLEARLRESLPRMSARLVAVTAKKRSAAKAGGREPEPIRAEELVPSHKLDWAISRAMVAFATPGAIVKKGDLAVRDDVHTTYRPVRVEWQKGGVHAVRAIDPIDATVEEVAATVLKSPTEAFRIRRIGDLFVIPKDADVTRGASQTQADATRLAFGQDAAIIETTEVERAMRNDVEAKAPEGLSFATLQTAWSRVNEQLTGLAIVVREFGLEAHLIAAVERHKAHRLDLATLAGHDAIVRSELFARQERLLGRIAVDIGSIVSESKMRAVQTKGGKPGGSDKNAKAAGNAQASADATRMALLKLVDAAGLAHLPETGEAVFVEAHAARRDTMLTTFEGLLGDISTQIEIARLTMAHTRERNAKSKGVLKTSPQERADALRARLAALRSRLSAGTASSEEVEALYAAIDALRFETSVIASIGQLGDVFETIDKLESTGWIVFSEWFLNQNVADMVQGKDTNRLAQKRRAAEMLRVTLHQTHARWMKVQDQANTVAEQLMFGGVADPHDKAVALVAPQLAIVQGELAALGGLPQIREFLTEAYDTAKSAEHRAMILKVAAMIGIGVISGGVGAAFEGAAASVLGPGIAAPIVGLVAEATTFTLVNKTLQDDPLMHSLASNFIGNLATFAALRGVGKALSGTAIGKTLAASAAGERVAVLSLIAAKLGSISVSTLVAVGVQFAQAEYESLLKTGKTMSLEELKEAGLQGIAMMIGAAIAHKFLGGGMQEMKALGMRTGSWFTRRAELQRLSAQVMTSGSPDKAIQLLHETREALEARGEQIEALGATSDKDLAAQGLSRAEVKAMAHNHQASVKALDTLETGTMTAQLGLDTVVPGQVYAGDPAAITPVLDSYRSRPGYRIEREGTGYHVIGRDGTEFHILERAASNDAKPRTTSMGRPGAGEAPSKPGESPVTPADPTKPQEARANGAPRDGAPGRRTEATDAVKPADPATEAARTEESIVLSGDDAQMRAAAKRAQPLPDYLDVLVHGDADSFWVVRFDVDIQLDQRSLATYLRKKRLEGQKIRLIACESGLTPFAVAQHLANKLGVEVLAPNGTAWVNKDGVVGVGPLDQNTGGWTPYRPKPSSQDGSKRMRVPEQPAPEPVPGAPEVSPPLEVRFDHRERYGAANHDELQAKLGKPLVVDPALSTGVSIDAHPVPGLFGGLKVDRVRVGAQARAQDILAHAELIRMAERYNGLLGKLRKLFDRLAKLFGRPIESVDISQFPHGSRGWALATEVAKTRQHLQQTHLDVVNGQIDAITAEREIEYLQSVERYFEAQLRTGDPKTVDASVELSLREPEVGTTNAKKAGYKLPNEPGGEIADHPDAKPEWYYYREDAPGVFVLARKPNAPNAPQLKARVVNDQFQRIEPPTREPAPLLKDIEEAGGHLEEADRHPLKTLYKPGMSMDSYAKMLEAQGIASRAEIDGTAMHYYRKLKDDPKATLDDWRHDVKEHFKKRLLDKITDPSLSSADSYRQLRDAVDILGPSANKDRANIVEAWYQARRLGGEDVQAQVQYKVTRTSGKTEGQTETRQADFIVGKDKVKGTEIVEVKDIDGKLDEDQFAAYVDALRDDKTRSQLGAERIRYVFTKPAGARASLEFLAGAFDEFKLSNQLFIEVYMPDGSVRPAANDKQALRILDDLRSR